MDGVDLCSWLKVRLWTNERGMEESTDSAVRSLPPEVEYSQAGVMSWLEKVKAGDPVIIDYGRQGEQVRNVTRTTATQIIFGDGHGAVRFRRKDGQRVGGGVWDRAHLEEPTSERLLEVQQVNQRARLAGALSRFKWSDVSLATLQQITQLISDDQHG